MAANDNGAEDRRNAQLAYAVPEDGLYEVRVRRVDVSSGRGGDYTLSITGATAAQGEAATVISTSPTEGSRFAKPPAFIDLTFSEGIRLDSIDPGDLLLDLGASATEVRVLDGATLRRHAREPKSWRWIENDGDDAG